MIVGGISKDGGRERSRGRDLGKERGHGDKGPRHCAHCGRNNHTSDKRWDKFSKPE